MITLLQPGLVTSAQMGISPAAEVTAKLMEKRLEARHAAVKPSSSLMSTGPSSVSADALVEAATEIEGMSGLLSPLTAQEVADQYAAAERLLAMYYSSAKASVPMLDKDV